jgi:hypothetical protein
MPKKSPIARGDRFRDAQLSAFARSAPDWVVEDVFTGTDGIEYALLSSAADPTRRKSLSAAILHDRRRFAPVPH